MNEANGRDKVGKLSTFNTRSETAPELFTLSNVWRRAQHCIIPADVIFEPDRQSNEAAATRFTQGDGAPLGIARLFDRWRDGAPVRFKRATSCRP